MSTGEDRCANCGETLVTRGGVLIHATGPQASKITCALNPYGDYEATRPDGATLTPDERAALSYTLYEYPLGSPQLEDALRRLAPAVERIVADRERAAAVEALREAADLLAPNSGIGMGSGPTRSEVSQWLRDRANGMASDA